MNRVVVELGRGVLSAAELRDRLGVSRATLMRAVREAGTDVVQIGRGRATRYGLRHSWPALDASRFPLFRITQTGTAESAGELLTLASRQSVWQPVGLLFEGLPIELADARPAGFLGRHFAAAHSDLPLPARLEDWSDHHILLAISRRGEDLPGNLIVGDESFARWQELVPVERTRDDYPELAEATIAGHPPGSSAGGDRPKFGVSVNGQHMLVKFVSRGTADPAARRWCDLLVLEGLALSAVASRGIPSARTHVIETESHLFLESERFDRMATRGRVAVLSLAAAYGDPADSWARAAVRLSEAGRLGSEDARHLRWLDAYGSFIANTDRHHHNIVFFNEGSLLHLAPAFDQASTLYAPSATGQVVTRTFSMPRATAETLEVWDDARTAAHEFWQAANDDNRLSDDIRRIAVVNAEIIRANS